MRVVCRGGVLGECEAEARDEGVAGGLCEVNCAEGGTEEGAVSVEDFLTGHEGVGFAGELRGENQCEDRAGVYIVCDGLTWGCWIGGSSTFGSQLVEYQDLNTRQQFKI